MSMPTHSHAVILAGGSGTRLWPASRKLRPKQLLPIQQNLSLLQMTAKRLGAIIPAKRIHTVTHSDHKFVVQSQLRQVDPGFEQNVLAEPLSRNTLPAIAWAVARIAKDQPDAIVSVFSSDQAIQNEIHFREVWANAVSSVDLYDVVLFGIVPTHPATGYGYIHADAEKSGNAQRVISFVEKPDAKNAELFLKSGNYFWNGGIFVFRAQRFLELLNEFHPKIANAVREISVENKLDASPVIYESFPELSVDYGLIEKIANLGVVAADIGWTDLGSWQSVYEFRKKDSDGNSIEGSVVGLNNKNSLLWSEHRMLAVMGVEDLVVVQTDDATLVCPRGQSENLKKIVEHVRIANPELLESHATVERPWGKFTVLEESGWHKVKRILVKPGERLSLQSHEHRAEHWIVIRGQAQVQVNDTESLLQRGQTIDIPKQAKHRLSNPGMTDLEIIEVQLGDYLGEDDITRFEDRYGRV